MAISVQIYSNANSSSRSISFDFVGDILSPSDVPTNVSCNSYYFKIVASGTQDNNAAFPAKVVRGLDELVLNKAKQRVVNTADPYSDIRSMIVDYTYDFIHGHTANLYTSGCTLQRPMKF